MTRASRKSARAQLKSALEVEDSSARLQAALTAGMRPDPEYLDVLIERCAIEPDFYVRDMLSWALTRHDRSAALNRLLQELRSDIPQARSQALHTLSKIGDPRTWSAIGVELLQDDNDEVARTAWRAAAGLVADGHQVELAETLSTQFNRGGRELQLSLSRAFGTLGSAASAVVERAAVHPDPGVRAHALATERIMQNPDEGFDAAIAEAKRTVALLGAPLVEVGPDADR
ncbi:MAG: HEAT repeat domain-containing protein [Nakamurella sp.]